MDEDDLPATNDSDVCINKPRKVNAADLKVSCTTTVCTIRVYVMLGYIWRFAFSNTIYVVLAVPIQTHHFIYPHTISVYHISNYYYPIIAKMLLKDRYTLIEQSSLH